MGFGTEVGKWVCRESEVGRRRSEESLAEKLGGWQRAKRSVERARYGARNERSSRKGLESALRAQRYAPPTA
eukprot:214484-Prymnesium_polylepis.1